MSETSAELAALRQRVAEAEATLEAIRSGRVDALVIHSSGQPSVYTLESADLPYRQFLEQMAEGALSLDAVGRIVFANRFFCELVGRTPEAVLDLALQAFLSPASADALHSASDTLAAGATTRLPATLHTAKRDALPVQIALTASESAGIRHYTVVITDLSERAQLREVSAAHEAVEAESIAKDQFLAALGHELRTPLGVVLGWTHMLLAESALDDGVRRGLTAIERCAKLQRTLIEDVLDLARISAGKLQVTLVPLDLAALVEASVSAFLPRATGALVQLTSAVGAGILIAGDDARLQQLLHNLLENAFKFTPAGGHVHVTLQRDGAWVRLTVADSGVGIEPALLPRVFARYRQEVNARSRAGGLGLGLSIARHISELHGGSITVDSQGRGFGTRFSVALPAIEASDVPAVGRAAASSELPALAGVRMLVVDGDDAARSWLRRGLRKLGAEVVDAESSARALALIAREEFDCVVADLVMRAGDGYGFAESVRARWGRVLALVAMSSLPRGAVEEAALRAGFDAFLQKPIDEHALLRAIRAACSACEHARG